MPAQQTTGHPDAPQQDQTRLSGIGSRLGGADPEGAAGGLDAAAASGTIEAEGDGLAPHSSPGCRFTRLDWWYCYGWDGAGVPGGRPNAEPGAGKRTRSRRRSRIMKGFPRL